MTVCARPGTSACPASCSRCPSPSSSRPVRPVAVRASDCSTRPQPRFLRARRLAAAASRRSTVARRAAVPVTAAGVQYWTSRGFAVVDVNYRGSTGFGRATADLLRESWGIADVEDCEAAPAGRRRAGSIRGGCASAAGQPAASPAPRLAFRQPFAAGAEPLRRRRPGGAGQARHPQVREPLPGPAGRPVPRARDLYLDASPIHQLDGFDRPLIVLQGLDDKVVPPNQSEMIVAALRDRRVPVPTCPSRASSTASARPPTSARPWTPSCRSTARSSASSCRRQRRSSRWRSTGAVAGAVPRRLRGLAPSPVAFRGRQGAGSTPAVVAGGPAGHPPKKDPLRAGLSSPSNGAFLDPHLRRPRRARRARDDARPSPDHDAISHPGRGPARHARRPRRLRPRPDRLRQDPGLRAPHGGTAPASAPRPAALVLVPTRELAAGPRSWSRWLRPGTTAASSPSTAASATSPSSRPARGVDIVVAYPGRLEDLIAQRRVDLSDVAIVVIDEADRMADMGFLPAVSGCSTPRRSDRQTLLFSATLDGAVDVLVRRYQRDPRRQVVVSRTRPATVRHLFWRTEPSPRSPCHGRGRRPPRFGHRLLPDQARRRPVGQASSAPRGCGGGDSRQPFAAPAGAGAGDFAAGRPRPSWRPTWPPGGSTSTPSAASSTSTRRPITRTTCTAPDAPAGRGERDRGVAGPRPAGAGDAAAAAGARCGRGRGPTGPASLGEPVVAVPAVAEAHQTVPVATGPRPRHPPPGPQHHQERNRQARRAQQQRQRQRRTVSR